MSDQIIRVENGPHADSKSRRNWWWIGLAAAVILVVVLIVALSGTTSKAHTAANAKASYKAGFAQGQILATVPANIVLYSRGLAGPQSFCTYYFDHHQIKNVDPSHWITGCGYGFLKVLG
jgi:hypothetical protein